MIKLIVLDVDGTMTDGKIYYDENGIESKSFSVKDGMAIAIWTKKLGKKCAIITGRNSKIVQKRADELSVTYCFQGIKEKLSVLEDICKQENITFDEVASIGDDLNDLSMLKATKLSYAPNDASPHVKDIVTNICDKDGGDGAVRYMIEDILKNQDELQEYLSIW